MKGVPRNPIVNGLKVCTKCRHSKPTSAFKMYPTRPMLRARCHECEVEYFRASSKTEWRRETDRAFKARNKVRLRWANYEYRIKGKYGIDSEDWARMYEAQDGRCLGCDERLVFRETHVDHCHKTLVVRGLLCADCNLVLGCVADSSDTLRRLAEYLDANENFASVLDGPYGRLFYSDQDPREIGSDEW
jgi:hypothetical protein